MVRPATVTTDVNVTLFVILTTASLVRLISAACKDKQEQFPCTQHKSLKISVPLSLPIPLDLAICLSFTESSSNTSVTVIIF